MKWQGYIVNPMGFDLRKIPQSNLYIFKLDPEQPLQFKLVTGAYVQPDRTFQTDMASIPKILQWIPGLEKDSYLAPYFHDSAYRHGGIWIDGKKVELTRKEADELLRDMLRCEGARIASWVYWAGVRMGGRGSWGKITGCL